MATRDKELAKSRLLDGWLADLRQQRPPRAVPAAKQLTAAEIAEVLRLARQQRALFFSAGDDARPTPAAIDHRQAMIARRLQQEREATRRLQEEAGSFGTLLRATVAARAIRPADLEQALAAAQGTLARLAAGDLPPHRVEVPTMLSLLRALDLVSGRVVELIRQGSVAWAQAAYERPQTQFGLIDSAVSDRRRAKTLAEDGADGDAVARSAELERIDHYCEELTAGLEATS